MPQQVPIKNKDNIQHLSINANGDTMNEDNIDGCANLVGDHIISSQKSDYAKDVTTDSTIKLTNPQTSSDTNNDVSTMPLTKEPTKASVNAGDFVGGVEKFDSQTDASSINFKTSNSIGPTSSSSSMNATNSNVLSTTSLASTTITSFEPTATTTTTIATPTTAASPAATATESNSTVGAKPQAKLNGLKNRIIQRPPPLVLDKVSNFYDNQTNRNATQATKANINTNNNNSTISSHTNGKTNVGKNENQSTQKNNSISQQIKTQHSYDDTLSTASDPRNTNVTAATSATSSNSVNPKFWASLNENASRNKALADARAAVSNRSSCHQQHKDQTDYTDTIGRDLVIKHRNSSSSINNSGINRPSTSNKAGSNARNQEQSRSNYNQSTIDRRCSNESQNYINNVTGMNGRKNQETIDTYNNNSTDFDDGTTQSEHGGSLAGGNLIGVDNSTPPATNIHQHTIHSIDSVPHSASSSGRPRSNNPFLDNDDDEDDGFVSDSRIVSRKHQQKQQQQQQQHEHHQDLSNFHKRPASFIAATTTTIEKTLMDSSANLVANPSDIPQIPLTTTRSDQQEPSDQFSQLSLKPNNLSAAAQQIKPTTSVNNDNNHVYFDQPGLQQSAFEPVYQTQVDMYKPFNHSSHLGLGNLAPIQNNNNNHNKMPEQSISLDSENTILQLPPSATLQLPHWTEATYKLNNAILETSSVAGGAENGQFIYIVESGDIILELDRVKVSGYTLVEFNQLVESKQFHLLHAVQTKHSYGLTLDLKRYLNENFDQKNVRDKEMQNLIRENIYRRTVPCTTRPARPGERDKIDYHFLTKNQFVELSNRGMLLECGVHSGHYYGTLKPLCDLNILSIYQHLQQQQQQQLSLPVSNDMRRAWDAQHPAVELSCRKDTAPSDRTVAPVLGNPLYENHESMQRHSIYLQPPPTLSAAAISKIHSNPPQVPKITANNVQAAPPFVANISNKLPQYLSNNIMSIDDQPLPLGWERVIDQTHGTYYIDHNTRRTQYERPYEVELTKGAKGFGFTLVEADNGMLLVRSIIQGGPAQMNGLIKPGDILVSAVGISVAGLQHTDVARLFSTFAVGDRVRLTFARSNFVLDESIVPDEYLFSNGTNGDLAIAVNPNVYQSTNQAMMQQNLQPQQQQPQQQPQQQQSLIRSSPHILVNQEFEFININLRRGDQGFGFTISDSMAGQKVKKIQNSDACANLKQGDILISINDEDITSLIHKEVVERLKIYPTGQDVKLTVRRKKRFRSRTPMAMHTDVATQGEYSLDSTPQRNCKTPSFDALMLGRPAGMANQISSDISHISNKHPTLQPFQSLPPTLTQNYTNGSKILHSHHHQHPAEQQQQQQATSSSLPVIYSNTTGLPVPGSVVPTSSSVSGVGSDANHIYSLLQSSSQYGYMPNALGTLNEEIISSPVINGIELKTAAAAAPATDENIVNNNETDNTSHQAGKATTTSAAVRAAQDQLADDTASNSAQASETCIPVKTDLLNEAHDLSQVQQQYNNYLHNDKLIMSQIQQSQLPVSIQNHQYHSIISQQQQPLQQSADYYQLYSNSEILKGEIAPSPALPAKQFLGTGVVNGSGYGPAASMMQNYISPMDSNNYHQSDNYYANNEEINLQQQRMMMPPAFVSPSSDPMTMMMMMPPSVGGYDQTIDGGGVMQPNVSAAVAASSSQDDYEHHHVDLERESTESNWGIRLIGGAEVDRAISIGSIVFGGAASKNGLLKSGDEIISINNSGVIGATHQHVVELISRCTNKVSLVVRRKRFAEACDVVLTRNMDEGFGFVIISSGNCALIGRIIEGSPADRCKQLHVRDRIIAVNGRYITPNMRHPQIVSMIKECGSTLKLRIIPVDCYTVELIKNALNDNFGFSIRGGSEYDGMPLYILRVAPNGLARDLLNVGDQILEINNIPTVGMTHQQAATIIKFSDPIVKLKLRRNYETPASLLVDSPRALQKFNQVTAEMIAVNQNITPNHMIQQSQQQIPVMTQQQAAAAGATAPTLNGSDNFGYQHHHQHHHMMASNGVNSPSMHQSLVQDPSSISLNLYDNHHLQNQEVAANASASGQASLQYGNQSLPLFAN